MMMSGCRGQNAVGTVQVLQLPMGGVKLLVGGEDLIGDGDRRPGRNLGDAEAGYGPGADEEVTSQHQLIPDIESVFQSRRDVRLKPRVRVRRNRDRRDLDAVGGTWRRAG